MMFAIIFPLAILLARAVARNDLDAGAAIQAAGGGKELAAAIQGAMLLSAALPQHSGPQPSKDQEATMQRAAPLFYSSYQFLQTAEQSIDAATQQMDTRTDAGSSPSTIAQAQAFLQRGQAKLTQARDLVQKAVAGFQNDVAAANPLAPQPAEPREWDDIESSQFRVNSKLRVVKEKVLMAKKTARGHGISLLQGAPDLKSDYDSQQDNKMLEFLSRE